MPLGRENIDESRRIPGKKPTHFRFLHCSTGSVSSRTSENFSKWLRNVVLPDKMGQREKKKTFVIMSQRVATHRFLT
jgi:hypothetical protein